MIIARLCDSERPGFTSSSSPWNEKAENHVLPNLFFVLLGQSALSVVPTRAGGKSQQTPLQYCSILYTIRCSYTTHKQVTLGVVNKDAANKEKYTPETR